jgi:hypothetical protein
MIDATLPLTPALGPTSRFIGIGERENHTPSCPKTGGWICRTAPGKSKSDRLLSPLPRGEGQGEGKRDNHFTSSTLLLKAVGELTLLLIHDRRV